MRTIQVIFVFGAALASVVLGGASASAQVPIPSLGVAVEEHFDTLAKTGANNTALPTGWAIKETGSAANVDDKYAADTGSGTSGNLYSYGANNADDRALGSLASGTLAPSYGARFLNDTGATITTLQIAYFGEWWRSSGSADDQLVFEYSTNASSLTTGSWTAVDALAFRHLDVSCHDNNTCGGTGAAKNGNAAGFRTQIEGTIGGVSIDDGDDLWIRWRDIDGTGADQGLAVDDFSLVASDVALPDEPIVSALKSATVVGGAPALPGGVVEYAVIVDIDSGSEQGTSDLVLTDALPASVTAITDALDDDFVFTVETASLVNLTAAADGDAGEIVGGVVTVRLGDLDAGDIAEVKFSVRVDATETAFTLANTASLAYDGDADGLAYELDSNEETVAVVACEAAADCNDDEVCTTDACSAGSCTHSNANVACSDGDACTLGDACVAGKCKASSTDSCNDSNPCTDDSCDKVTGCDHADNDAPCDDGDACTEDDQCAGGTCDGGSALDCDDDNPCTTDACDEDTGCEHTNNTLSCNDGDPTTHSDKCGGGDCDGTDVVCPDPNPCQVRGVPNGTASCPPTNKPDTATCNDNDASTVNDHCDGKGVCIGTSSQCPPDPVCKHYTFNGSMCVLSNLTGACDDGNAGTRDDTCSAGACGGTAYTCTPSQCEATSVANGVDCTVTFKGATATCNDGATGTRDDRCNGAGGCAGTTYTCTPGTCEASSVPDGTGCVVTPKAPGAGCDDGDPCSDDDVCTGGVCGGAPRCDVGELCGAGGVCTLTHCEACGDDGDCGRDSACLDVGGDDRCLVACTSDDDCAVDQVCRTHAGGGGLRCFDASGDCAAPDDPTPDEDPEVGPETADDAEEVEPTPDESDVSEESPDTSEEADVVSDTSDDTSADTGVTPDTGDDVADTSADTTPGDTTADTGDDVADTADTTATDTTTTDTTADTTADTTPEPSPETVETVEPVGDVGIDVTGSDLVAEPVRQAKDDGCSGGAAGSGLALALVGLALVVLRRQRQVVR